jgi:hypothetical protein
LKGVRSRPDEVVTQHHHIFLTAIKQLLPDGKARNKFQKSVTHTQHGIRYLIRSAKVCGRNRNTLLF